MLDACYTFLLTVYTYHYSDVSYQPQAVVEHVYTCIANDSIILFFSYERTFVFMMTIHPIPSMH